ncbi:CrcB protein [Neobacillus bataviensis LMG 21833]|uniref:Fluoride-specific ion channel FluC n=2 Tax=Neobacillus bataviensis TaxID=220685 RepID=K6CG03_9BACI|nr:CrcB protein [Neobacillus bataviensis LMG 21833]
MVFVGVGGIFGAISRYFLGSMISRNTSSSFPIGTWFINVIGSFSLGLLAILHIEKSIPEWVWLLVGTGFLGAFTTFSTFGYETIQLLQQKETKKALLYITSSVVVGVLLAWIGGVIGHEL